MKKNLIFCSLILLVVLAYSQRAKNVIYLIGDGMGQNQTTLVSYFLASNSDTTTFVPLTMDKLPVYGLASTYAKTRLITCSAAAGTALATGHKTHIDGIAYDSITGQRFESIATLAKKSGEKVGIITTSFMNDATPAAFYAHVKNRKMYDEIFSQLIGSGIDLFAGGGINQSSKSKINVKKELQKNGYVVVESNQQFLGTTELHDKMYFFAENAKDSKVMPYRIDNKDNISLAEMTKKAIELLDNPNGFLLVVEGGIIDWAAHDNDAAAAIAEIQDFDSAVGVAYDFYMKHPDETLIVVTADHETGGLGLGYKGTQYNSDYNMLSYQKHSYSEMEKIIEAHFKTLNHKLRQSEQAQILFNELGFTNQLLADNSKLKNALDKIYSRQYSIVENKSYKKIKYNYFADEYIKEFNHFAGIDFTTYKHTAAHVPIRAIGVGSEQFRGLIDNTDIPKNIIKAKEIK